MNDKHEEAFRKWQSENEPLLISLYPATVGYNGASNNYDWWCRQVYTGRIKLNDNPNQTTSY